MQLHVCTSTAAHPNLASPALVGAPCSVRPSAPGLLGTHLPLTTAPAGSALLRCWEPICAGQQGQSSSNGRGREGLRLCRQVQPCTFTLYILPRLPMASCKRPTPSGPAWLPLGKAGRTLGLPPFRSVSTMLMVSSGVRSYTTDGADERTAGCWAGGAQHTAAAAAPTTLDPYA